MPGQVDASIISQIPDMAPNPLKAQQDAYTLYDTKNRIQLNSLTLQQAKEEQADKQATKKILQSSNLSTDQGKNVALEKVARVSPDIAMKMQKDFAVQKGLNLDNEAKKLQVAQEQLAPMISAIDSVLTDLQPMKQLVDQGKMTQSDLDGLAAKKIQQSAQNLIQNNPELAPYINQALQNPNNLKYSGLVSLENQSKQGREMTKQRLDEIKTAQAEHRLETSDKREQDYQKNISSLIASRDQKEKDKQDSNLSSADAKDIAEQYMAGDKSVLTGLGRSGQNMVAVRKAIRELSEAPVLQQDGSYKPRMTPAERAAKIGEFNAFLAEERKLGGIAAPVEFSSKELDKFIPLVEDASAKVPRGKFVPVNKLLQMGQASLSDPNLKTLQTQIIGALNAYDVLAARGGSDVAKREQIRSQLMAADGPKALSAALAAMKAELKAAGSAGKEAKASVAAEISGNAPRDEQPTATPARRPGQNTSGPANPTNQLSDDELIDKWNK